MYQTALVEFQRTISDRQLKDYGVREVGEFIFRKHQVRPDHGQILRHTSRLGLRVSEEVGLYRLESVQDDTTGQDTGAAADVPDEIPVPAPLVRTAGPDEKVQFHSLRHTLASWRGQDEVSLYEVQRPLGHSVSAVTQMYAHLQPEARMARKIGSL